jgi:hypothetical protein
MVLPVSAWSASPLPAVLEDEASDPEHLEGCRAALDALPGRREVLLDRGSYEEVVFPDGASVLPGLVARVGARAAAITGRPLTLASARALRFHPGDYRLVRDDRVYEDRPVEVIVDLSREPVPGAEVHYRHRGQVFFVVPSSPGVMSVVERGPTVLSNHTYLSLRHARLRVVRLVLLFTSSRHA